MIYAVNEDFTEKSKVYSFEKNTSINIPTDTDKPVTKAISAANFACRKVDMSIGTNDQFPMIAKFVDLGVFNPKIDEQVQA